MTVLRIGQLLLRAAEPGDLHDLHAIFSNADAMRYWSTAPHESLARTQESLDHMIAAAARNLTYFVIENHARVIGMAGLYEGDEIGFMLHPAHWRKGYGTQALQAIIPYLFDITDLAQLTADVDPRNAASIGLLTSLGFQETHRAKNTFCINGNWADSIYFALERRPKG